MNPEDQRTSCPGFLDQYGVWNNGFECPPLTNQIRVCCGSDSHRYCCGLEVFHTNSIRFSSPEDTSSIMNRSVSFTDQFYSTIQILPVRLTCMSILILLLVILILLSLYYCFRRRTTKRSHEHQQHMSNKQILLADHFPFTPPHHQLFFNEPHPSASLLHSQPRDTFTTTTTIAPSTVTNTSSGASSLSSSSSARAPSDIYFRDWKEFFITNDQPMNVYPGLLSHSTDMNNDLSYIHPNQLYHKYYQQDDIIV